MLISNEFRYPAMLRVAGRHCVIVGGGTVATRKLQTLCMAGAQVTVIAPAFCPQLEQAAKNYSCTLIKECYRPQQLQNAFVVIAATDDKAVNREITAAAPALVNNVTEPELSNFTVPSSVCEGSITIALATGGMPAFTRLLKQRLAAFASPSVAAFNDFLLEQREIVKGIDSTPQQRTLFWRKILDEALLNLVIAGKTAQAKEKVLDAVNSFRIKSQNGTCRNS